MEIINEINEKQRFVTIPAIEVLRKLRTKFELD